MELTAQQVNDFIAKAIMDSQIGKVVKEAVERQITELSKSYNNPFDGAIRQEIAVLIEKELRTLYSPILAAKVKEVMERTITDEMIQKIVDAGVEKIRARY